MHSLPREDGEPIEQDHDAMVRWCRDEAWPFINYVRHPLSHVPRLRPRVTHWCGQFGDGMALDEKIRFCPVESRERNVCHGDNDETVIDHGTSSTVRSIVLSPVRQAVEQQRHTHRTRIVDSSMPDARLER